jgi:hypothetical protein
MPPAAQYPRLQGWDTETVFTNVDPKMIKLWNDVAYPKLFVYPWEAGYQPDASGMVHKLSAAIAALLSIPRPAVGAPLAAIPPARKSAAPWCFLVTKLPPEAAKTLLSQQYWATPTITFFAIPYAPPPSPYVCTIENLTYVEPNGAEALRTIKDTIRDSVQAEELITRGNPDPTAFHKAIHSIRVRSLQLGIPARAGGGTKLVWNVYIDPPFSEPSKQREWRAVVSSLKFLTALNGAGVAQPSTMHCLGCKSIDHPAGLCPVPAALGWNNSHNATPEDIPTSLTQALASTPKGTATRGRGTQRGRRGRGRSRGAYRGN